jgi:peroxiredoxin
MLADKWAAKAVSLKGEFMPIAVGSKAPDFTLKSKTPDGLVDVTLSSNFGKANTVLVFFPAAFTGVCTTEFCDLTGGIAEYSKLNAEVYGVSTDSPFAQEAWAQASKINITLLSDYKHDVIKAYEVVWPDLIGLGPSAARAVVVIDNDGVVRYTEQTPTPGDMPDFDKLKAALQTLS